MDQPKRTQLYDKALARAVEDGLFDEATASRLSLDLKDVSTQLERFRALNRGIGGKRLVLDQPRPRLAAEPPAGKPAGPEPPQPQPAAEPPDDKPAAGYTKGAEMAAAAEKECKAANARRQKAVEALANAARQDRPAARAAAQEEDAAIAFHKSAQAYGHALMEVHEDRRVTAEEARLLARLLAEMSLRRKNYEEARAVKSKLLAE